VSQSAVLETLRTRPPKLSVGILAADAMDYGAGVKLLEQFGVLLHLDVMDGRVWPTITAGAPVLAGLRTSLLKDVHLLIEEPEKHVAAFAKAGADVISFSIEHCRDVAATLDLIATQANANDPARGIVRGVSLDPATPVDAIAAVRALNEQIVIFVDGAVTKDNIGQLAAMGPNGIVTGSAAFAGNPAENIQFMLEQISV
jgi:ribulose-phosphate 3-epimerase